MTLSLDGATAGQVEEAVRASLAEELGIPESALTVTAQEARRLSSEHLRRLATTWSVSYQAVVSLEQASAVESSLAQIRSSPSSFSSALTNKLVEAGAPAIATQTLELQSIPAATKEVVSVQVQEPNQDSASGSNSILEYPGTSSADGDDNSVLLFAFIAAAVVVFGAAPAFFVFVVWKPSLTTVSEMIKSELDASSGKEAQGLVARRPKDGGQEGGGPGKDLSVQTVQVRHNIVSAAVEPMDLAVQDFYQNDYFGNDYDGYPSYPDYEESMNHVAMISMANARRGARDRSPSPADFGYAADFRNKRPTEAATGRHGGVARSPSVERNKLNVPEEVRSKQDSVPSVARAHSPSQNQLLDQVADLLQGAARRSNSRTTSEAGSRRGNSREPSEGPGRRSSSSREPSVGRRSNSREPSTGARGRREASSGPGQDHRIQIKTEGLPRGRSTHRPPLIQAPRTRTPPHGQQVR